MKLPRKLSASVVSIKLKFLLLEIAPHPTVAKIIILLEKCRQNILTELNEIYFWTITINKCQHLLKPDENKSSDR